MSALNEKAREWFERQRPLIGYRNDEDDLMFKYVLAALEKMKIERKDLEIEARHLFEWAMGFPPDDLDLELWADQLEGLAERLGQPALKGPEEEERKEMVRHWNAHIANYSTRTCPVCIKIFNLVMGKGAADASKEIEEGK